MTGGKSEEVVDDRYDMHPAEEQFSQLRNVETTITFHCGNIRVIPLQQNTSNKRKSIFMRLVENNEKRGSIMPDVNKFHDSYGRYNRARSIHTPQRMKIMEEPDLYNYAPLPNIPSFPSKHRLKTSKHTLHETSIVLPRKDKTYATKPTPPKSAGTPMGKPQQSFHEMQQSEDQVGESGKQIAGIPKHTPSKHTESHSYLSSLPSHPKDDLKGKISMQSFTFDVEEVTPPLSKPFRVRRKSVFGHTDVLEKLTSGSGLEQTPDGESDRYYDGQQKEHMRTVSREKGDEYATKNRGMPDRAFDAQQMRYRRISQGRFRPSMHPFIGLSEDDRASLTNIYNKRQTTGGKLDRRMMDNDGEETEIEVGKLMSNSRKDSLRKSFLSLGLKHLKGNDDDIREDERLTMEDQVNIVAQVAMEGK